MNLLNAPRAKCKMKIFIVQVHNEHAKQERDKKVVTMVIGRHRQQFVTQLVYRNPNIVHNQSALAFTYITADRTYC